MVVDFSKLDLTEPPVLILKNASGEPIGTLGAATEVYADIKYNESSVLEFAVPAWHDGAPTPYYDFIKGLRIVELLDIGQFILINPTETGDGLKKVKACTAYSLEYEFTFKKITLENATYNFWNPVTPDSTLLGVILELMPAWHVGHVDEGLIGKYRTFEVEEENVYNFIKNTVQQSYSCIFDFDTYTRAVNVIDASSEVAVNPIYISNQNLAEEISVEEDTENIVTRLDVNGAEGVNIRDVNPTGTNQIINLDYFMTTDNFSRELIDKYHDWKKSYEDCQLQYYNLSVDYTLRIMSRTTEEAALKELEGGLTSLENQQAVIIQAIAKGVDKQESLDAINVKIEEKKAEIEAKKEVIAGIQTEIDSIYKQLSEINDEVRFETYFTKEEFLTLNQYIKDDALSESSFVVQEAYSYTDNDIGNPLEGDTFSITSSSITYVTNSAGKGIYEIKGGTLSCDVANAEIIRASLETKTDSSFVMSAYLGGGQTSDRKFPSACLSLTGTIAGITDDLITGEETPDMKEGTSLTLTVQTGYLYFTLSTSEYEKKAVAWDLFNYGRQVLEKQSQPSYHFNLSTANFLCLEDFVSFKNKLRHGEKIYVGISEDETLAPICTGVKYSYSDISELELEFSSTYLSGESTFLLTDLLEQSVSMGKSVDLNKFGYSAFLDSGANTKVHEFFSSALDVAKNTIISSREQAITWGDSGIRLRKWTDETHTAYEPQEVWMNNNSVMMTNNGWSAAELAIGEFKDENLGMCWGVVAPNIVGTLLAGNNLVIESEKEDGGVAVFKVDAEGCVLHNSYLSVTNDEINSHILIDPDHGIIIGKYPLITLEGEIDDEKKLFYADTEGNLTLKGTIYATDGEFSGRITALSGYIGTPEEGWEIGDNYIYNGKSSFGSNDEGIYIGTDGFSLGNGESYIRGGRNGLLEANNVNVQGNIVADSGLIGGCEIADGVLQVANANITNLSADKITGGTLDCGNITVTNLSADSITVGRLKASQIEGLPASQIVSGQFVEERIPNLNASKITAGTIDASQINITNLNADNIKSGTISADRIKGGELTGCSIRITDSNGDDTFKVTKSGSVTLNVEKLKVYYDPEQDKLTNGGLVGKIDKGMHEGISFQVELEYDWNTSYRFTFVQGVCTGFIQV